MKRSHSSDDEDKKRGRITAITDTSTSTTTRGTATHIKKVRKDGTHLKHHLRRGPSLAASAEEYIKTQWTNDELDLTKDLRPLTQFVGDSFKFIEEVFSIFSSHELKSLTPDILKDLSVNQLKELCVEELKSISPKKIKFICEGNKPEDFEKLTTDDANTTQNYNKRSIANTGDKSDDIQLSVDDNEYSDFLGAENIEFKVLTKDAEVQANESSLESSSDEEGLISDNNKEDEGWMNIFAKTQMEILELEMRARAIRSLMKAQEDEDTQLENDSKQTGSTIHNLNESKEIESKLNICEEIRENKTDKYISNDDLEADNSSNNEDNECDDSENSDNTNDVTDADNDQCGVTGSPIEELTKDESIGDYEESFNDDLTSNSNQNL